MRSLCAKRKKTTWSETLAATAMGLGCLMLSPAATLAQDSGVEIEVKATTGTETSAEPAAAATPSPTPNADPEAALPPGPPTDAAPESPDAIDAIEAAEKLIAPPTAVATPAPETTPTQEIGPTAEIKPGVVMIRDQSTKEAKAVASGAEILRMLGLGRPAQKLEGREMDTTQTVNLFKDEDEVRRLLGENPTVVYRVVVQGTPLPDPMVIPWLRNAQIVQEMLDDAINDLAEGRVVEAQEQLRALIADYSDTDQAIKAQEILDRIILVNETPGPKTAEPVVKEATPTPTPIEINPNVRVSTVLIEPNNPADNRVVIGGRGYAVGETLRGYSDHKVLSITDDTVIIEVEKEGRTKQFPLPVRPSGSNP